jgi:hypothetical protein
MKCLARQNLYFIIEDSLELINLLSFHNVPIIHAWKEFDVLM